MRKEVRNKYNIMIGWIENDRAYHLRKGYVGYLNNNITYNKNGVMFCYGDALVVLIWDCERGIES